jgi:hypothetical protein
MSSSQAPKRVLSCNIDEDTAEPHDLLITYASSLPTHHLPPLHEWLRAQGPTGPYQGPKPTYQLKFDWTTKDTPVEVINRAMERCFGTRGVEGWQLWIRGDQLNLLVGDFRKEYLRVKGLGDPESAILDLWVDRLLTEMKRM